MPSAPTPLLSQELRAGADLLQRGSESIRAVTKAEPNRFTRAFEALNRLANVDGIPLAIVSGLAAIHFGYPAITADIDIVVAKDDLDRLLANAAHYGFKVKWRSTTGLPKSPLDGELWIERKSFQQTVSIVRRQDKSDHWKQIRYLVFDAPTQAEPFEERLKFIAELLAQAKLKYVQPHKHERCRDLDHLQAELARVEALGGEGLMLRQPGSKYEAGRSTTLLKVKTFHDADGVVVDHVAGKGRHKGRLGALVVKLPDGTEFSVGTGFSDKQRESPPAVGSTTTFRYQELSTGGVPRFPSFVRGRKDAESPPPGAASDTARPEGGSKTKVATKAAAASPAPAPGAGEPRYFEYVEASSSKFWEIVVNGAEVTVRFGRIGTNGQTQTKSFADAARATADAEKLIGEKTGKGYVEK